MIQTESGKINMSVTGNMALKLKLLPKTKQGIKEGSKYGSNDGRNILDLNRVSAHKEEVFQEGSKTINKKVKRDES